LTPYRFLGTLFAMRRTGPLLAAFLLFATATTSSAAVRTDAGPAARGDSTLERKLAKALRAPHVSRALTAAVAFDLTTGQQLFGLNDALPLVPASNEKLALTFALLKTLGPTARIETSVEAAGTIRGGTLDGKLFLVGGGDPTLSSGDLARLARRVRARGIRRVTGNVVGDESAFDKKRVCPGWKSSFYLYESPPLSALVVDRAWFENYTARRPAKAAALIFRNALRAAGVTVDGRVGVAESPPGATRVARTLSAPLADLIAFMDQHSDNFTAEQLLKVLSLTSADRGSSAAGARVVLETLAEAAIPTEGLRIVDGSGLSAHDRLTATALVGILSELSTDPLLGPSLLRALPVAGRSGTLRDRMRTPLLAGNVVAKTGTTSLSSSLAGYVNSHVAFAIIQNGHPVSYWWARAAQDRFATILAKQG
jgi:D-alanyl-D-alanine carboxypeptidase/D-alanyl-D-alanine-endopeptidase (penicillin-binding protein 4)